MAGLFAASIKEQGNLSDLGLLATKGIFSQQHLGEDFCGMSWLMDGEKSAIQTVTKSGTVLSSLAPTTKDVRGKAAIAFCGRAPQPLQVYSKWGNFAICVAGGIDNLDQAATQLMETGRVLSGGNTADIIANLVSSGKDLRHGLDILAKTLMGSYAILILHQEGVAAIRSPDGRWPLLMGEDERHVAIAIDSSCFSNFGLSNVRDLAPGEVVVLRSGVPQKYASLPTNNPKVCPLMLGHTLLPFGVVDGVSAASVRHRLGAALARRDIALGFIPDEVIPIPHAGRHQAVGYVRHFIEQLLAGKIAGTPLPNEFFVKPAHQRAPGSDQGKEFAPDMKYLAGGKRLDGKKVVVCDHLLMTGDRAKSNLIPALRDAGAREIHLRISHPIIKSPCRCGVLMWDHRLDLSGSDSEEMAKNIGVDSLVFTTPGDLLKAIGLPKSRVCLECNRCRQDQKTAP